MICLYFRELNKKNSMFTFLFMKYFRKCFILELKKHLKEEGLEFEVILIINNALDHSGSVCYQNWNVKVAFLSPHEPLVSVCWGLSRSHKLSWYLIMLISIWWRPYCGHIAILEIILFCWHNNIYQCYNRWIKTRNCKCVLE